MRALRTLEQRVCLTFCRRDKELGDWLRRELAAWRIESDLVGRWTPAGAVPKTLRPIRCNREDVARDAPSGEAVTALQQSQFLIVLCSPAAADNEFVDEQIRRFQAMGRAARVIPVVVAGEPGIARLECLPPALRFKLMQRRRWSPALECPIDLRPHRDGREGAKRRIIAALLGLPLGEIEGRAERRRQRRMYLRHGAAATLIALSLAIEAGVDWVRGELYRDAALLEHTLAQATAVTGAAAAAAQRLGLPQRLSVAGVVEAETRIEALAALGRDTARLRLRRATMRIELARSYDALGDADAARARASDAGRLIARLAAEAPDNPLWQRELSRGYAQLGDLFHDQGRFAQALTSYRESIAISERLAAEEAGRQRELAERYRKLGDLDLAIGAHNDALGHYHESLAIQERLAAAEPGDARRQHGVLLAHQRIGDALREKGELDEALASYQAGRALAADLTRAGDAEGERALAAAHVEIGDVLALQDQPAAALASYRMSHAIAQRLADANEAGWQDGLRVSHERIGFVLEAQGDLAGAVKQYRTTLTLAARSARAANGQRELAMAHGHLGDALRGLGDLGGALAAYREKRGIIARLAGPDHAGWQHELGTTLARIGFVHEARGDLAAAQKEYEALFAIGRRFAAADPDDPHWQRDLAVSHGKLAAVHHRRGKAKEALSELRRGRDIMAALVAAAPEFAPWAADLAQLDAQIAAVEGRGAPRRAELVCEPVCAGDAAAGTVAFAIDLRERLAARPVGGSRRVN